MSTSYDAIIIGTGQAGPSLANRLNGEGQRVALIEGRRVGGTCVNVGCIPTKTMVASARAAHFARRAEEFGVVLGGTVSVDMSLVKARTQRIAGQSNQGLTDWIERMDNVDLIRGYARFVGPKTIRVNAQTLTADRIFINVGARPSIPDIPGLDSAPFLLSSDMLELARLPDHLIVIGASYIGLEFGQMFRRFGSKVTILERGTRIIGREDHDISAGIRDILESEGVQIRTSVTNVEVESDHGSVTVRWNCRGNRKEVAGSDLLIATGRTPNTGSLNLETAGVETDARGFIHVDDELQTSTASIWALGDVNGRGSFTHTSYNDYEIVAANLLDNGERRVSDRITCYGLFVDPPLGRVGMSEAEARKSGRNVLVGKWPMSNVGRAREQSETEGFIKILVDGDSKQILGAAILGLHGDEVVHGLIDMMYLKAPYTALSRVVHIHPTVSELIPTTLQNLIPLE